MASKLHHGLQREPIAKSMSVEDSVIAGKNGKKIVHDWLGNGKTFSGEQTTFLAFHLQRCQIYVSSEFTCAWFLWIHIPKSTLISCLTKSQSYLTLCSWRDSWSWVLFLLLKKVLSSSSSEVEPVKGMQGKPQSVNGLHLTKLLDSK